MISCAICSPFSRKTCTEQSGFHFIEAIITHYLPLVKQCCWRQPLSSVEKLALRKNPASWDLTSFFSSSSIIIAELDGVLPDINMRNLISDHKNIETEKREKTSHSIAQALQSTLVNPSKRFDKIKKATINVFFFPAKMAFISVFRYARLSLLLLFFSLLSFRMSTT